MTSATTAAVLVAAGAGLVLVAPPADAVPVPYTAKCVDQGAPELPLADGALGVDIRVSPAKPAYKVGDEVTLTWAWTTYPKVPENSPLPTVPADSTQPKGQIVLGGAQTGSVPVAGERKNPETPAGAEFRLSEMTGTVKLTAAGQVSFTPGDFARSTSTGTGEAETRCTPASPVPVSTTLTVEGDAPRHEEPRHAPTLTAGQSPVAAGGMVTLAGTDWPGGAAEVSLCKADGGKCDVRGITANTVAVAGGRLTGTATLDPATAAGSYTLKVKVGTTEKTAPVTVAAAPQAPNPTPPPAAAPMSAAVAELPAAAVVPGTLSMSQAGTAVDFGTATLDGSARTLEASLNQVAVTDTRDGALGWSLTGTMTDLAHADGTQRIPARNVSWAPNCVALPGSPGQVTPGAPGPLDNAVAATLCTQAPGGNGAGTGGQFTADARLTLTTPQFAAAGAYTGALTLTLI